jgi:hypothetical protein
MVESGAYYLKTVPVEVDLHLDESRQENRQKTELYENIKHKRDVGNDE